MSFSTDFLELMPDTVKVSTRTTHNLYGEPSFAATTSSYRARIVASLGYVRNAEGEEVGYDTVAWVRSTGTASITASDRITLPTGAAPSTRPPVVGVERYPDEDGIHHTKVMFGH